MYQFVERRLQVDSNRNKKQSIQQHYLVAVLETHLQAGRPKFYLERLPKLVAVPVRSAKQ